MLDDEELFVRELFDRGGLLLQDYRWETLGRRMSACLRALKAKDARQAHIIVAKNPVMLSIALSTLVIGVTQFFRDPVVFDGMAARIPGMIENGQTLRIWSAGCSDGAELYSVAMLLDELGILSRSNLVGTDCRWDAVVHARGGKFSTTALRMISPARLSRYFVHQFGEWTICPKLMAATHWRLADVLRLPQIEMWDMILCRNLAIYLKPESTRSLWRTLAGSLRPGGLLILGTAEKPTGVSHLVQLAPCIFRKAG